MPNTRFGSHGIGVIRASRSDGRSNAATEAPSDRPNEAFTTIRWTNTYSRVPTTTEAPGQKNDPSRCGGRIQLGDAPARFNNVKHRPDCTHAELFPKRVIEPVLPSALSAKYAVSPNAK